MWIGHRKEIRKLTVRALALRWSESRNCGLCVVYIQRYWLVHGNVKNNRINWLNEKRSLIPWGLRVPISKINFCSTVLRLSVLPWCRERAQTAICCLEWLERLKCLATSLDAFLSSFSTSRRCSVGIGRLIVRLFRRCILLMKKSKEANLPSGGVHFEFRVWSVSKVSLSEVLESSSLSWKKDFNQFITAVNSFHSAPKYTWEISDTCLAFLDIKVSIEGNGLCTSVHSKPSDSHSYLLHSSSHSSRVKNSIPYSQFLRLRRLCTDDWFFLKIRGNVRFLRQTWLSCFCCSSGPSSRPTNWSTVSTTNVTRKIMIEFHSPSISLSQSRSKIHHSKKL